MNDYSRKTLLITGGTGSFGHQLLDVIRETDVKEIRIFSRDELKQEMMRLKLGDKRVKFYLGDVRDRASVDQAMRGVDLVFHAAALKQVPSCEFFPIQAVMTNVIGSQHVIETAVQNGVESVVCLGTDKAVLPINAMGMTKGLMEKVAQAAARGLRDTDTRVCSVRYGNVMYSRGSVIPLFVNQIFQGQPLTITNPQMTRFLLSLRNAIDLVQFAFRNAQQGDIFVRKAPAATVEDLAQALLNLFEADNPIQVIGTRHAEKLFETLATVDEIVRSEDLGEYLRVSMDDRDLNYAKYVSDGHIEEFPLEDYTSHNTTRLSVPQIEQLLLELPEVQFELARRGVNRSAAR